MKRQESSKCTIRGAVWGFFHYYSREGEGEREEEGEKEEESRRPGSWNIYHAVREENEPRVNFQEPASFRGFF